MIFNVGWLVMYFLDDQTTDEQTIPELIASINESFKVKYNSKMTFFFSFSWRLFVLHKKRAGKQILAPEFDRF